MRMHRNDRNRNGATVVEMAVVISIFLLFLYGIFEYCRFVATKQILENAAREGARFAVVHTNDKTTAQIQDQVDGKLTMARQQMVGYVKTTNITVFAADSAGNSIAGKAWDDAAFGENIGVQVSGTYKPILPNFLFMSATFPITAKAIMASEAN